MRSLPKPKRKVATEVTWKRVRDGIDQIERALIDGDGEFPSMVSKMVEMFHDEDTPRGVRVSIFDRLSNIVAIKEATMEARGLNKTSGKSGTLTQNFLQVNITPEQFNALPEPIQRQMIDAQVLAITKPPEAAVA